MDHNLFIYLGFYVAFNTVQVISRRVVGRAEETSTYSSLGFCTVNCRPMASNYQLCGSQRNCHHLEVHKQPILRLQPIVRRMPKMQTLLRSTPKKQPTLPPFIYSKNSVISQTDNRDTHITQKLRKQASPIWTSSIQSQVKYDQVYSHHSSGLQ